MPGVPSIGLGHNANVAWAMTTGGPDTADIYELKLKPTWWLAEDLAGHIESRTVLSEAPY